MQYSIRWIEWLLRYVILIGEMRLRKAESIFETSVRVHRVVWKRATWATAFLCKPPGPSIPAIHPQLYPQFPITTGWTERAKGNVRDRVLNPGPSVKKACALITVSIVFLNQYNLSQFDITKCIEVQCYWKKHVKICVSTGPAWPNNWYAKLSVWLLFLITLIVMFDHCGCYFLSHWLPFLDWHHFSGMWNSLGNEWTLWRNWYDETC